MKYLQTAIPVFLLACFMTIFSTVTSAQDPTLPPDGDDPVNAPIDGGVSLLVAAAIGYGAKKAHDSRKKMKMNNRLE
jgi:hypothetical protein